MSAGEQDGRGIVRLLSRYVSVTTTQFQVSIYQSLDQSLSLSAVAAFFKLPAFKTAAEFYRTRSVNNPCNPSVEIYFTKPPSYPFICSQR